MRNPKHVVIIADVDCTRSYAWFMDSNVVMKIWGTEQQMYDTLRLDDSFNVHHFTLSVVTNPIPDCESDEHSDMIDWIREAAVKIGDWTERHIKQFTPQDALWYWQSYDEAGLEHYKHHSKFDAMVGLWNHADKLNFDFSKAKLPLDSK